MLVRIACVLAAAACCPALAHDVHRRPALALVVRGDGPRRVAPRAAPVVVPIDPTGTVVIATPFAMVATPDGPAVVRVPHYEGPDGRYDTPADLTNAINGVPCGVECTARSLERWGYRP